MDDMVEELIDRFGRYSEKGAAVTSLFTSVKALAPQCVYYFY